MNQTKQLKTARRRKTFTLDAPSARQVSLVGDFNHWNPLKHPMRRNSEGVWQKAVMLGPGTYEYKFWVDERWVSDVNNDYQRLNNFGTINSLVTISPWRK